jgi:EAL and modified HD-GYP domain-containing signal transduction protein
MVLANRFAPCGNNKNVVNRMVMNIDAAVHVPVHQPFFDDFFLARQPILNREQRLVAYELLFRNAHCEEADVTDGVAATASVIAHAAELGMEQVIGQQLAYVNVDTDALMSDFLHFLPPEKVVLEILESVTATPEVIARVRELKLAGYKFALDDVVVASEEVDKLGPLVDLIKVDIHGMSAAQLSSLVQVLKNSGKELLAEKVETRAQFEQCMELGFSFFQGYYFARPVVLSGKKMAPSGLAILNLLELINSDADNKEIERYIKHDALLSLSLLRLANSPAFASHGRIDTLGQALMMLGRRQLQRWLQIMLYALPDAGYRFSSPLLQMATTRGRLLELITEKLRPGQRKCADIGFTVGIMSLMDALFSIEMSDILANVRVLDKVREALLHREGYYGNMLTLVEQLEEATSNAAVLQRLEQLQLSKADLHTIQLAAFNWVHHHVGVEH